MNNWCFHPIDGIIEVMILFKKRNERWGFFQSIERLLIRCGFFKKISFFEKHAIQSLNIAQFLGGVNDNLFKYLIVFFLIDLKGASAAPTILSWVGTIYVLPFLFFSSGAGVIADRYSKQKIIVVLKFSEIIIMLLGTLSFLFKNEWASYSLLFLLSMQSAIFGPPKYSIIPEIVKRESISKANGLITSFTYFGIIFGTFLASFLTQITGRNFPLSAGMGALIAVIGFVASILLPVTKSKRSKKQIHPLFIYEVYTSIKHASHTPHLLIVILGSASFLFAGAYFQLNLIPYAMQSMHFTEIAGGYLFLLAAVGIGCGAFVSGKISHQKVEIGMACLAGIGLSLFLFLLVLFHHTYLIYLTIFFLGFCGGLYVVPFDSFVQRYAPDKLRGQIIAASSFLGFCGVFIASILLYLLNNTLNFTANQGFVALSVLFLLIVLFFIAKLSGYIFNYIARIIVALFYNIEVRHAPFEQKNPFILIVQEGVGLYTLLLPSFTPHLYFYIFRTTQKYIATFAFLLSSVISISVEGRKKSFIKKIGQKEIPCLSLKSMQSIEKQTLKASFQTLKKVQSFEYIFVQVQKKKQVARFKKTTLLVEFTKGDLNKILEVRP